MKKSITKLMLHQETLRTLANHELPRVVGGVANGCPDLTRLASGCTTNFHADSLVQNPTKTMV